ncbi:MAG TPA: dTDP-4-dehydrorhamnose reductase [Caulobacteraceae bacterium]|nr:dTDP-4-dehydrorhamnose reductase [Caulobacteraceae bacterium]
MVRILQFGATGQLAREMLARGQGQVTALSRTDVDLVDAEAVERAILGSDAELVVNAAAYNAVDKAESEEALAFAVNAHAPTAMARACAAKGIPLVHVSTDCVFDGSKDGAWTEDDEPGPLGAYGRSKLAGERGVLESGADAVVLRTSWVFSPFGRNFLQIMLQLARTQPQVRVVDDQHGKPTCAGDMAAFLIAAAPRLVAREEALFGLFHFANPEAVTRRGFAEAIFAGMGLTTPIVPITTAEFPTPAARPLNAVLDCGKLERAYGVRLRSWREGLAETLAVLKAEGGA